MCRMIGLHTLVFAFGRPGRMGTVIREVVASEPVPYGRRSAGADGHHALLTWAEIDPDFGRAPVLLAVRIDGTPLDRAGPQLVVPQDRCGARHISGITAITVDGQYAGGR